MNWQPIETAPRDGTVIDVWVDQVMSYGPNRQQRFPDARWENGAFVHWIGAWDTIEDEYTKITHWMKITPPQSK